MPVEILEEFGGKKKPCYPELFLCKNSSKCKKVLNKREYTATIIYFF
jgi:aminopeptidase C